ncbi:sigma 54-interacting transcriptional regulator [Maledivibacter halophilus]|uniref:Transcriptional regulator containing an AAA-type ATPase domain and a DNA-binding domain n=1 Tax=Maledivibacter halophilus TaxID=36842 RepID=A0A1T5M4E4_9FIRM|nr:sigma-54-dependent transcriptional regulator [Maledivibacter halophilus]SKC83090.1 Transcriptional regulator containing an AAA-type ATPase domain and a DNA-binding domain [Maledivibacter halophilus]
MSRKDTVLNCLKEACNQLLNIKTESYNSFGFTANEISQRLKISRANASNHLNSLVKENKIIKIDGRPVKFLDNRWYFDESGSIFLDEKKIQPIDLEDEDPFNSLVGSNGSLKSLCELAKAAILYPPNGLHTLILGQSGTGKSLIASLMYDFALYSNKLSKKNSFIVLNCADYSNNPHLLVSLLFGHVKGAFTGADADKEGLVNQAEHGILFLDEIHRLPPAGQEMLFSIIDKGVYRKVGSDKEEKIQDILIIGATTEDPNKTLLTTFLRRIPIILNVPPLNDRPIKERVELIKTLFKKEANKINIPIQITAPVIKILLTRINEGNIGKLKSIIQYSCAKGFLNHTIIDEKDLIITQQCLPEDIGLTAFTEQNYKIKTANLYILPEKIEAPTINKKVTPSKWYKKLNEDINELMNLGYTKDQAILTLGEKLDLNFNYNSAHIYKEQFKKLYSIIPQNVINIVEGLIKIIKLESNIPITTQLVSSLSLFVGQILNNNQNESRHLDFNYNISKITKEEKTLAIRITDEISKITGLKIPKADINFLSSLIHSINILEQNNNRIPIIILSHGENTATSIANVVNSIFGEKLIYGFDLSLEGNFDEFFNRVAQFCIRINQEQGILFLVDMGSLVNVGKKITKLTGIETATIDCVSTPIVLEAVNKHFIINDLEKLVSSILEDFKYKNFSYINNIDNTKEISSNTLNLSLTLPKLLSYYVDYLDIDEITNQLNKCIYRLQKALGEPLPDNAILIFIAHLTRLIEKIIIHDDFSQETTSLPLKPEKKEYSFIVKKSLSDLEAYYQITIPDHEISFLTEILFSSK